MLAESVCLSQLEVPSWPTEVYPFEPPHGLFARFAQINHQESTAVFASHVGINWKNPDLRELGAFCSKYPVKHIERLVHASPLESGKLVIVNGQSFNRLTDWTIYQPRICEACLAECVYHRNWWDIAVLEFCPIHDRPLILGRARSKLKRWHSRIGVTTDGIKLAALAPRAHQSAHPWERYILGRMGVMPMAPVLHLDSIALHEVIETAEFLGRLSAFGWKSRPGRILMISNTRATILRHGSELLLGGFDRIFAFLCEFLNQAPMELRSNNGTIAPSSLFSGPFSRLDRPTSPLYKVVRGAADQAIDATGAYVRRANRKNAWHAPKPISLTSLANELRLSRDNLRDLAVKLNLTHSERRHGTHRSLSVEGAAKIKGTLEKLIRVDQAAKMLDLKISELRPLCEQDGIQIFIRMGKGQSGDHFLKADIESLQTRLKTTEGALLISASRRRSVGGGHPRTFVPRSVETRGGLRKADAARALAVSPPVVMALISAGHLRVVGESSERPRVVRASLEEFSREYAPATLYAETLGCPSYAAGRKLRAFGVRHLTGLGRKVTTIVRRDDARVALGIVADPDLSNNATPIVRFWKDLSDHMTEAGSCMRFYGRPFGYTARLYAGAGIFSASLSVNSSLSSLVYEINCDEISAPRRHKVLQTCLSFIDVNWAKKCVIAGPKSGDLRIKEESPECISHKELFRWVEKRTNYLRALFTPAKS